MIDEALALTLIDTHAHLEMLADVEGAVRRAKEKGVRIIVAVGSNPESNLKVLRISAQHAGYVLPAFGLHPWDLPRCEKDGLDFLLSRARDCVALGEVGLDHWIKVDRVIQRAVFDRVLSFASAEAKPVMIHSRGAWAEALEAVMSSGVKRAVFHWYSGPADTLRRLLHEGFLVSASPAAAYSRAHREALRLTPLENLVLETDSPVKYGGVESEPSHVWKSLKAVAELKGVGEQLVAERTTANAERLLGLRLVE